MSNNPVSDDLLFFTYDYRKAEMEAKRKKEEEERKKREEEEKKQKVYTIK